MSSTGNLEKPALKGYLMPFPLEGGATGFRGGIAGVVRIRPKAEAAQRALEGLVPLLDGTRSVEQIVSDLAQQGVSAAVVQALLEQMRKASLIEDAAKRNQEAMAQQQRFFSHFAPDGGDQLADRLKQARVAIIDSGHLSGALARQLIHSGVDHVEIHSEQPAGVVERYGANPATVAELDREALFTSFEQNKPDLLAVPQEGFDPALLRQVNQRCLELEIPWLLIQVASIHEVLVGPLFIPNETACYACFEGRVLSNLTFPSEYRAFRDFLETSGLRGEPQGALLGHYEIAAGIASIEMIKLITDFSPPTLAGKLQVLEIGSWLGEVHDVLRLPRCGTCHPKSVQNFPWKEAAYAERIGPKT